MQRKEVQAVKTKLITGLAGNREPNAPLRVSPLTMLPSQPHAYICAPSGPSRVFIPRPETCTVP